MFFHYQVTKYNPCNRDVAGRYLKNEWTSYCDIGKSFCDGILSFDDYIDVENKYIESVLQFMNGNQIRLLSIVALEKKKNPKYDPHTTALMTDVFEDVKNGDAVTADIIDVICRLILREFLWCKLEANQVMQVHFSYDYYMFILSRSSCNGVVQNIERRGLFVEKYKSPYFINDAFVNSLNIMDGVIVYNEFDIDEDLPFHDQPDSFREHVLRIQFGHNLLIDVGWRPAFNQNGSFVVAIIKHYDWQKPIKRFKAKSFKALKKSIEDAVLIIKHQTR